MGKRRNFARYKTPKIAEIKESIKNLENQAKFFNLTEDQLFDSMLRGIIGDITDSTEIIMRENQRIKKAKKILNNILLCSFRDKHIRRNVKDFYDVLLQNNIFKILNKFKTKSRRIN